MTRTHSTHLAQRICSAIAVCAVLAGFGNAANAQAFADLNRALVDYSRADIAPSGSCADFAGYHDHDVVQIHAEQVAPAGNTPGYCRLAGLIDPEIAFEVSLPAKWNGRFYMIGNGGLAGESLQDPSRTSQRDAALAHGFAVAQTNTGHDSRKEPGGTFVLSNPQKAIDYAYRAVHATATTARDFIKRYYSRPVRRAYWNSCSNGGRQGLIEAQRYPQDFDGVIANAPWLDQTGYTMGAVWNQQALNAAPLSSAKLTTLAAAVMKRCDAIDGVKDGLIDDPRKCDFDAHRDVAACTAGSDAPNCLTSAEADTVMKIYRGPVSDGKPLFPGYMPGSEAVVTGGFGAPAGPHSAWVGTVVPAQPGGKSADFNLAEGIMRYLVHKPPQPDYDTNTFNFDRDVSMLDAWGKLADAKSTDLNAFRARGGKLLITHGWADQILQPLVSVHYYGQLRARYGNSTDEFVRLFMVPGMTHCSGGNGTDSFDPVTAIVDWVEKDKAPGVLDAAHIAAGKVQRTRPLCPYPQVARYKGSGSIDDAANFSCRAP